MPARTAIAVHVGGGATNIVDGAGEAGVGAQALGLGDQAGRAARGHDAALMGADGAKGTGSGTAAMGGHRPAHGGQGRYPQGAMGRMFAAGEGQGVDRIQGGGIQGQGWRLLDDATPALILDQGSAAVGVLVAPDDLGGLGKALAIALDAVPARQVQGGGRGFITAQPATGAWGRRQAAQVMASREMSGDGDDGLFSHAVDQQVGFAVGEEAAAQGLLQAVKMDEAAQAGFNPADDQGQAGKDLTAHAAIGDGGPVGSPPGLAARAVAIFTAALAAGRVVVDQGIKGAGADPDTQPGSTHCQQVFGLLWLGHHADSQAFSGQDPSDDGDAEGGVIDVGVSADQQDIQFVPAVPVAHFGTGHRQGP